jgi:Uma2 family endonuclease
MVTAALITNDVYYPDSDGKPVGETPLHIRSLFYVMDQLNHWFAGDPHTCVAGDMFVYYEEGNSRKHVSPDIFVARAVAAKSESERRRYLVWLEGKSPDLTIELTSQSTSDEDLTTKMVIYRDILKVREYFLFDPEDICLKPRLQGFRLLGSDYVRIEPVAGRLPSEMLGLHLEADGFFLRFYEPVQKVRLPIPPEVQEALLIQKQAFADSEAARDKEGQARQQAEAARAFEAQARQQAEVARVVEGQKRLAAEAARAREEQRRLESEEQVKQLRRELEELRRQLPKQD